MRLRTARRRVSVLCVALAAMVACGCGKRDPEATKPANDWASVEAPSAMPFKNKIEYELVRKITTGVRQLRGLAVDGRDRLYTASADGIGVFSPEGRRLQCWRTTSPAHDLAVAGVAILRIVE